MPTGAEADGGEVDRQHGRQQEHRCQRRLGQGRKGFREDEAVDEVEAQHHQTVDRDGEIFQLSEPRADPIGLFHGRRPLSFAQNARKSLAQFEL